MTVPTTRRWGPDRERPDIRLLHQPAMAGGLGTLLDATRALSERLGVPVQAVRADRVLGRDHLVMAATHAARALESSRARADDPAVEFLLYAAAHRQIRHGFRIMGVPREGADAYVVVLGPVDPDGLPAVARDAGFDAAAIDLDGPRDPVPARPEALAFWADHLGVPAEAPAKVVEDALFAAMAGLAVARA